MVVTKYIIVIGIIWTLRTFCVTKSVQLNAQFVLMSIGHLLTITFLQEFKVQLFYLIILV